MSRPIRMATTGVRVRRLSVDAPVLVDSLFGDQQLPTSERFGTAVDLQGQPRFFQQELVRGGYSGDLHPSLGYVVFSRAYLQALSITPHSLLNAHITSLQTPQGWEDCNLVITEVRDRGHLTGGSLIVKCFFKKYGDEEGGM